MSSLRRAFLSQEADAARLPVALLSGFLGSGKTTLVNALLRDPRLADTAVAVNEFGDVPLDRDLIDHGADSTVVMANGCLCCNLSGDLEDAVMRLHTRRASGDVPRFRRLIVEPSGLADPAPIAQAIMRNPVMARALRLEAVVTTVDCLFAEAQLARHAETRKQVMLADVLVLTKPDLADADAIARLRAGLRRLNPVAAIHVARDGDVDAGLLFPGRFFDPAGAPGGPARSPLAAEAVEWEAATGHADRAEAASLFADRPLRWRAVEAWLRDVRIRHAERLLRVKGLLNVEGVAGPVVVHGVHHVLHAPVALDAWPGEDRRSRLVLIADGTVAGAIRASWETALPDMLAAGPE